MSQLMKSNSLTIVLDNIRSAWNVGSIMRTCDALGANLILVGYTPKPIGNTLKLISKTAIGAEKTVKWYHFDHPTEVFEHYPHATHYAIEISNTSHDIFQFLKQTDLQRNKEYLLWFGNEIHGINSDLLSFYEAELHLPMKGSKESLNVSSTVCAVGYLFLQHVFDITN